MVAYNTGARRVECIKVLGGSKRRYCWRFNSYHVKTQYQREKLKRTVHKAVVVRKKMKF